MSNAGYPPGTHRPEWETVLVNTGQKSRPVGDPTSWGGTASVAIDSDPVLGNTPRVIATNQIVLAQAADRYSRSWSITGVLFLPSTALSATSPDVAPPSYVETFPVTPTTPPLAVWLSIKTGIERISFEQNILLSAGNITTQNFGLCQNQNSANGGPYGALIPQPIVPPDPPNVQLPFACIGALVGNMITARAIFVRGPTAGEVILGGSISAMITPYAPGAGI